MSKTLAVLIITILLVIALHAFRSLGPSNIKGRIYSPGGEVHVWAVRGTDSVKAIAQNGQFRFNVQPGSWKVLFGTGKSLNDMAMTVNVEEGKTMDLGLIRLY